MDRILRIGTTAAGVALVIFFLAAAVFRPSSAWSETMTITYAYDQKGQLVKADYGSSGIVRYVYDQAGNRINREVVIGNTRTISINYGSGGVGSFFTLRGAGFPPNSQILIVVNNLPLLPNVTCDGSGNFLIVLSTDGADYGIYSVSAVVASGSGSRSLSATLDTVSFMIISGAPVRAREAGTEGASIIAVPARIALPPYVLLLPLIQK
jgi:hypothetical protein